VSDDLSGRLSRWSQRKLAARRGAPDDAADEVRDKQPSALDQQPPAPADAVAAEGEETPVLPSIDELTAESDYTVFLGKNVPEALKDAALRKLWRSDPVFAVLDGLNDYDEDFNVIDTLITSAQTSYKVGTGYIDDIEEKLAKLEPANSGGAKKTEHADSPDASGAAASDTSSGTLGKSDAPGDEPDAAPRQMGAAQPDDVDGGQAEDKGD
jgi:hypothetical protein